jgi:hypothetical protein
MSDLLTDPPPLRELRLLGNEFDHAFLVNLSLPFLTHLEISGTISTETFLKVLRNFPILSHFEFGLMESDSYSISDASTPIIYPNISSIIQTSETESALGLVTFPNLRFLKLPGFSDPNKVRRFISRSSCVIDHLVISFEGCDEVEIASWLEIYPPSVSVLEITECPDVAVVFHLLDSPTMMPLLTDVSICSDLRRANLDNEYDDVLLEMLHHRTDPARSHKLRRFHIKLMLWPNDYDSRVWSPGYLATSALERLIADGLDFAIHAQSNNTDTTVWPGTYIGESPMWQAPDATDSFSIELDPVPYFP